MPPRLGTLRVGSGRPAAAYIRPEYIDAQAPLQAFRRAESRQEERNLLGAQRRAGQALAAGDVRGAAGELYAAGDIRTGRTLETQERRKAVNLLGMLQKGALRADTNEKWQTMLNTLSKPYGEAAVAEYRDFSTRGAFVSSIDDQLRKLDLDYKKAQIEKMRREDQYGGLARPPRSATKLEKYEWLHKQGKITTQQLDRLKEKELYRPLPISAAIKLGDRGEQVTRLNRLESRFKPEFTDPGLGGEWTGNIKNWAARTGVYGDRSERDRADWWQDYQSFKNEVRNKLFGSALTQTEKVEFDKANIHPGMPESLIRRNVRRQLNAARRAAKKLSASAIRNYGEGAVFDAFGLSAEELEEAPYVEPKKTPGGRTWR